MNIPKRILWVGLVASVMLSAGAAMAQENPVPPNPGDPPPAWHDGAPPQDALAPPEGEAPELPEGVDPAARPRRPRQPVYTYTATLTCSTSTRLEGETQGEVAQSYSSLRESIGSSEVLAVIPGGAVFEILDGPVCSGGYNWYQVSYNGVTGWVTEGYAGDYWLEPVDLD